MIQVSLPLSVVTYRPKTSKGKIKKWILNLNNYRNSHYRVLSIAKKEYHKLIAPLFKDSPQMGRVSLWYQLWTPTRRKGDLMNVMTVVDKFTQDSLVELGIIEDDNTDYVPECFFFYGGVSKENPRVKLWITDYGDRNIFSQFE